MTRMNRFEGMEIINTTPSTIPEPKRRHKRPMLPTHSGPPSQSLVITTKIPPITVRYNDRVQSYSRHQIAKDLGLSVATISTIFTGTRGLSLRMAIILRDYFRCSLDYLIDTLLPESQVRISEAKNEQIAEILNERVK